MDAVKSAPGATANRSIIVAVTAWRDHDMKDFIINEMEEILEDLMWWLGEPHLRVGDATGGDKIVLDWCRANDVSHHQYRADWDRYGRPAAGPIRNNAMLRGLEEPGNMWADLLLAFPEPGKPPRVPGSGSWGCVGEAFKLGIRVMIPPVPRGEVSLFRPTG